MKIKITRASAKSEDSCPCKGAFFEEGFWWVEMNTLEDLFSLKRLVRHNLIIGTEDITIYDGYIE